MGRQAPPDDAKTAARRRRRAADTARWRSRQCVAQCGNQFEVEFGGLGEDQTADKVAIAAVLGRLLRRALVAQLRENIRRR